MKLTVVIQSDNAAFEEDAHGECFRLLGAVQGGLRRRESSGVLLDINGNAVGRWVLMP